MFLINKLLTFLFGLMQDMRMCKTEPGVTVDYNHRVYDEDCFGDIDILNLFDFPMESLEGDGLAEDWASKLGPIPSEVLGSQIGVGNNFGPSTDLPFEYPVLVSILSFVLYFANLKSSMSSHRCHNKMTSCYYSKQRNILT